MGTTEDDVRMRIAAIKKEKKWTENSLAKDPATQKRLNRQLSHDATITLDTILLILAAYPDISADWLLRGTGTMTTLSPEENNPACPADSQSRYPSDLYIRFLCLLEQKDRQIERLIDLLSAR